jgi:hypothetical protein
VYENSSSFLEQGLMIPVLVMLSMWSIGDSHRIMGVSDADMRKSFEQNVVEFHRLQASCYRLGVILLT